MFFIISNSPTTVIINTRIPCLRKLTIIPEISFILTAIPDRESYTNMLIVSLLCFDKYYDIIYVQAVLFSWKRFL
jgi:hypothetical protein